MKDTNRVQFPVDQTASNTFAIKAAIYELDRVQRNCYDDGQLETARTISNALQILVTLDQWKA